MKQQTLLLPKVYDTFDRKAGFWNAESRFLLHANVATKTAFRIADFYPSRCRLLIKRSDINQEERTDKLGIFVQSTHHKGLLPSRTMVITQ
jgi:hypothetical protein